MMRCSTALLVASALLLSTSALATPAAARTRKTSAPAAPTTEVAAPAVYTANWTSIDARPIPAWYDDAKFGLFIHWGVYSVPAWQPVGNYAEWYWYHLAFNDDKNVTRDWHAEHYGQDFTYNDFAPMFTAQLFDAAAWADLFVRSGVKYIVPTSKHHEGFALWPSRQAWTWNAAVTGPHRDLLGEILTAVRARGLHGGLYYSLYEWLNPEYLYTTDTYVDQHMLPQLRDLVSTYQPDVIWTDGEWEQTPETWRAQEFLADLFNNSPIKDTVVVNDRWGKSTRGLHGGIWTSEYSSTTFGHKWELCMGIDNLSFGFNRATPADQYQTASQLLNVLIRTVSNGGNLLLDIGPQADGTIPTIMQERLLQMGDWLAVNGEAIYATTQWKVAQDGTIDNTTVRYTASKQAAGVVYAHLLTWPTSGVVTLEAPIAPATGGTVSMLGVAAPLQWKAGSVSGGLTVTLPPSTPGTLPCDYVWVLKLTSFK